MAAVLVSLFTFPVASVPPGLERNALTACLRQQQRGKHGDADTRPQPRCLSSLLAGPGSLPVFSILQMWSLNCCGRKRIPPRRDHRGPFPVLNSICELQLSPGQGQCPPREQVLLSGGRGCQRLLKSLSLLRLRCQEKCRCSCKASRVSFKVTLLLGI